MTEDGRKVGEEFQINTTNFSNQDRPSVAYLNYGRVVVVWESFRQDTPNGEPNNGIFGQILSRSGRKIGGEFQINVNTEGNQRSPQVIGLTGGTFAVSWVSNHEGTPNTGTDIYVRTFTASGRPKQNHDIRVNMNRAGDQDEPTIAALSRRTFGIFWQSEHTGNMQIHGQIMSSTGDAVGDEFAVTNGQKAHFAPSAAAHRKNSLAIVYEEEEDGGEKVVKGQVARIKRCRNQN